MSKVPVQESPYERFNRLAEDRLAKIENAIRVFANLANPYTYEYTEQDKREAFDRILLALQSAENKFATGLRKQEELRPKPSMNEDAGQVAAFRAGRGH
jgi:hypothetical protein